MKKFLGCEHGSSALEYVILLSLVASVMMMAASMFQLHLISQPIQALVHVLSPNRIIVNLP